jgi:hypothetical protein
VTTDSSGERGLLGIAFDPDCANNHWVYIYLTFRVSRRAIFDLFGRIFEDFGRQIT